MSKTPAIDKSLAELFDAERAARRLHDQLAEQPSGELLDALTESLHEALAITEEEESVLRLVRIAQLLGELEGPRVIDALIDVLASELPEARKAAGDEIEELAFDRFKEVAGGVERALKRLPTGSPALPELPYLLAEVPEPGVLRLLGQFMAHDDPDAVAAAIEALVEIGDPGATRYIEPLVNDERTVDLAEEDESGGEITNEITIGELAQEALELLGEEEGDEDDDEPVPGPVRGKA